MRVRHQPRAHYSPTQPRYPQAVFALEPVRGVSSRSRSAAVLAMYLGACLPSQLSFRVLTDVLNALVSTGAFRRVTEAPARLAITNTGRKLLNEYRS